MNEYFFFFFFIQYRIIIYSAFVVWVFLKMDSSGISEIILRKLCNGFCSK